jgi:uncharacterized delta-60 repeat protein
MRRMAVRNRFTLEQLESRETPAVIGTLDPSWGTAGKATVDFGNDDSATAAALQPDGKLVVVGGSGLPGGSDFVIARYNPDGTLDGTFGGGSGKFVIDFTGLDRANAVAIQPDGKIVIAGTTAPAGTPQPGVTPDMAVARVNANGTIDTSFNGSGGMHIDLGGNETATGVAVRPDGRIVVVGSSGSDFAVVQLTSTGGYDPSFKGSGKTTYDFGGTEGANAIALQSNGLAVIVGTTTTGGGIANNFAVLRIDPTGTPDAAFSGDGAATVDFGFNDSGNAVAIQSDGRIVLAGTAGGTSDDFAIARLNTDGTPDANFGTNGITLATFGGVDRGTGVAIQPDGKIVVVGSTDASGGGDMGIVRLASNGGPDASFGINGLRTVDFGSNDFANGVVLTPTGRIDIVGGSGSPSNFAAARLIGTVEEGRNLGVAGPLTGGAVEYIPSGTGIYFTNPSFTLAPFGAFSGNVRTAIGDVNGDGVQDTVVVSGPGISVRFAVVSGVDNKTLLVPPTAPFAGSTDFTGGCFVSVGDFDGDGHAEIVVTPDQGGGSRVSIYSLLSGTLFLRANFLAFPGDANFRGGVRPAVGDVNGDGVPDLAIAAGFLGGPRIGLFGGKTLFTTQDHLVNDFFAFPGDDAVRLRNGVYIAAGDVNGDGFADLIFGGGPGGAPRVFVMSGQLLMAGGSAAYSSPIANFFVADNSTDRGGIRVAAADADGDNKAEVAVGTGQNVVGRARVYFGRNFIGTGEPAGFQDFDPFNSSVLADGIYVG